MSLPTTSAYAVRPGRAQARRHWVAPRLGRGVAGAVVLVAAVALGGCTSEDPALADLPSDVASARPTISAEEARFVLAAQRLGATVTGATVDSDIETGTTTCWVLRNGGVDLDQVAVDEQDALLPNTGEGLRTKQLMAAGVQTFCPDQDDQIALLELP